VIGVNARKIARVGQIGSNDDILDTVEDDRADGVEQYLVPVRIDSSYREAPATRQATKAVGSHAGRPERLSYASTWPLVAVMNSS
jgi:hypothetical protein